MVSEGIQPNIITYNSLMTTCANSSQWAKACEVYSYMIQDGCHPDLSTFTNLLGALMNGGSQWTTGLLIFEDMHRSGYSRPDKSIYNAVMDILWASGDKSAQTRALFLWRQAQQNGNLK